MGCLNGQEPSLVSWIAFHCLKTKHSHNTQEIVSGRFFFYTVLATSRKQSKMTNVPWVHTQVKTTLTVMTSYAFWLTDTDENELNRFFPQLIWFEQLKPAWCLNNDKHKWDTYKTQLQCSTVYVVQYVQDIHRRGGMSEKIDGLGSDPGLSCDSYITFYCTNFLPNGTKYQTQYFSHTVSLCVSHKHIHKDKLVKTNCWPEQNRAAVNKNNSGDCKCAVFVFIRRNELYMASCPLQANCCFFPRKSQSQVLNSGDICMT